MHLRVGWSVRPFDFRQFENNYDLRLILEEASVRRLCDLPERAGLDALKEVWLVPRRSGGRRRRTWPRWTRRSTSTLVEAAGNPEVARCHRDVTERIRIIRRLDFTQAHRIDKTYDEHAQILRAVIRRRADEANRLLRSHIEASKAEVRKITAASPFRSTGDRSGQSLTCKDRERRCLWGRLQPAATKRQAEA